MDIRSQSLVVGGAKNYHGLQKSVDFHKQAPRITSCHIDAQNVSTYLTHYCVVRADIPIGAQAANLIHAAGQSSPGNLGDGTYAVALTVKDEATLRSLAETLTKAGLPHHMAIESDAPFTGQAMAIGIAPSDRKILKPYLSQLPLLKAPLAQPGQSI